MKKYILMGIVAAGLFSCKSQTNMVLAESVTGTWELDNISGASADFNTLYPNTKPYIEFSQTDSRVSGKNSCNSYSGKFTMDGHKLHLDPSKMMMTKMFCEGEGEKAYMSTLAKVNGYSITDNGKTLNLQAGNVTVLRYHKK